MINNKLIIVYYIALLFQCNCALNVKKSPFVLDITIVQNDFYSINYYLYKISNYNLVIYSCRPSIDSSVTIKRIYRKNINTDDLKILNKIAAKKIFQLDQEHVAEVIGGYYDWKIYLTDIQNPGYTKYIHVQNKEVQSIDSFFMLINEMIPKKKLKIPRIYVNSR